MPTLKASDNPAKGGRVNFRVAKMDRCQTLLPIDKKGYESTPQRSLTHPDLARISAAASPHPIDSASAARVPRRHGAVGELPRRGHMPSNRRKEEWEKTYQGRPLVGLPVLPRR